MNDDVTYILPIWLHSTDWHHMTHDAYILCCILQPQTVSHWLVNALLCPLYRWFLPYRSFGMSALYWPLSAQIMLGLTMHTAHPLSLIHSALTQLTKCSFFSADNYYLDMKRSELNWTGQDYFSDSVQFSLVQIDKNCTQFSSVKPKFHCSSFLIAFSRKLRVSTRMWWVCYEETAPARFRF